MKGQITQLCCFLATFYIFLDKTSAIRNRARDWGNELTGETEEATVGDTDRELYKSNLLQYVFRTETPTPAQLNTAGGDMPYVMNKLYEILADRDTGREKRSPFDVDLIRGLQDHWGKHSAL